MLVCAVSFAEASTLAGPLDALSQAFDEYVDVRLKQEGVVVPRDFVNLYAVKGEAGPAQLRTGGCKVGRCLLGTEQRNPPGVRPQNIVSLSLKVGIQKVGSTQEHGDWLRWMREAAR